MHNVLLHPKAWYHPKKSKDFHVDDIPGLTGKVALVTGGTYDVGFEVAKALASAKARVIILSPQEERAADALEHIRQHCRDKGGHPHPDVDALECDLASLQDVKRVGDEICQREERLDIVVCTAGLGLEHFQLSKDGLDKQFAVTYLAHFLLLNRLLPLLRRTASASSAPPLSLPPQPGEPPSAPQAPPGNPSSPSPPRIILQASTLHTAASPTVHFLTNAELSPESSESSSPVALYARAQLATLLFAKRLARLLAFSPSHFRTVPTSIRTLAADPGPVHPERPHQFQKAYGPVMGTAAQAVIAPFERAPADACASLLWAATAPEVDAHWETWQGAYVSAPGVRGAESSLAKDEEREELLWSMSETLLRQLLGSDALHPWTAT